jgi:hypothetical protein
VPPPKEIESGEGISVEITVKTSDKKNLARGIAIYNALRKLSKINGALSSIDDPSVWQRNINKDIKLDR